MRQCPAGSGAFLDEAIRPGNDLVARHGGVALPDYSGSAVRRTAASGAGPVGRSLRHNKSGRGRSSCRSAPASDSPRKGTAALISRRYGRYRDRHRDDRRDCRDTAPACVPSTCGARRRCGTAKFEIGAVPAPRKQQALRATQAGSQPDADQRNSNISSTSAARLKPLCPPEPTLASDPVGIRRRIDAGSDRHRQEALSVLTSAASTVGPAAYGL